MWFDLNVSQVRADDPDPLTFAPMDCDSVSDVADRIVSEVNLPGR